MVFDENLKNEEIRIDFENIQENERGSIANLFDKLERLSPSRGRISFDLTKTQKGFYCKLTLNAHGFQFNEEVTTNGALEAAQVVMEKAFEALRFWKQNRFDTTTT